MVRASPLKGKTITFFHSLSFLIPVIVREMFKSGKKKSQIRKSTKDNLLEEQDHDEQIEAPERQTVPHHTGLSYQSVWCVLSYLSITVFFFV